MLKLNVDYDRVKEQFKFLISEDEEDDINETKGESFSDSDDDDQFSQEQSTPSGKD